MLFRICVIIIQILLPFLVVEQDDTGWALTSATPLPIPNDASPRVFPSPDGTHVAYERAVRLNGHRDYYLCVLEGVSTAEPACALAPLPLPSGFEPDPLSPLVPFRWSPDGTQIAAVGQPLGTQADTDLWLLNVASGEWRNLTDDSYDGALTAKDGNPAPPAGVSIELQPAWSPDGTMIAVEHTVINDAGGFAPSTLAVVNVSNGEVRDLGVLPGSADGAVDAGSVTGMDWSRDGATLALTLRHRDPQPDVDGLWLVQVDSGESERILSMKDAESALQGVITGLALESLGPVVWSPDGTRLLFWAGNPSKRPAVVWPFVLEVAEHTVTAVTVPAHPSDKADRRVIRPLQAAWSPDGAALLVLTFGFPTNETVNALDPQGDSPRLSVRVVDVESGSDTALGHLPLGPSNALYFAVWGAGGAITNGYYLAVASR
ncbi:MAG: PD40 domain-containing protein [Chloroflexi bacterium]|nr:PD40 domain-containing protein [Chloroflexota bacterium]